MGVKWKDGTIALSIYGCWQAFTGHVADVHANHAAREREIIQVIATDEGGRLTEGEDVPGEGLEQGCR